MFKKSFYLAAVFSTALFSSCQHDPQPVNSTWHKPGEGGTPIPGATSKENVRRETANRSETNEAKPAANTGSQMGNSGGDSGGNASRTVNANAKTDSANSKPANK